MRIDEKFKDASPVSTYMKIIQLLHTAGIQTTETWIDSKINSCFSLRVSVDGTSFSSNGKGVTKQLARASAYGELMERLQGGSKAFPEQPTSDSVWLTREELLEQCSSFLAALAQRVTALGGDPFTAADAADAAIYLDGGERARCVPYYNVNEDSFILLPVSLLIRISGSNGMAAGNSTEEALVQGFSELVERKCQKRLLYEKLTPPVIPDEYLSQFPTAWEIITQTRQAGYDVSVRDCSLQGGYPTIAAVVINKETHSYHVHLGAFPVFEIALERAFTEVFQGRSTDFIHSVSTLRFGRKPALSNVLNTFVWGYGEYPAEFFGDKPSYPFEPFEDLSKCSNAELVQKVMRYIKENRHELFIRDMSFLGLPALRLCLPGVSDLFEYRLQGKPPLYKLMNAAEKAGRDLKNASFDGLMSFLMCYKKMPLRYTQMVPIPLKLDIRVDELLGRLCAAYCAYGCGNMNETANLVRLCNPAILDKDKCALLTCLRTVIDMLLAGYKAEEALDYLKPLYVQEVIEALAEDFRAGRNPFERFIPSCSGNCEDCKENCNGAGHPRVQQILAKYALQYDKKTAMDKLADCVRALNPETAKV